MADENDVANLTIEILKDIQARVGKLDLDMALLRPMPAQLAKLESDMALSRKEVAADFAEVRSSLARLDANTALGFRGIQDQLDGHRLYAVDKDRGFDERLKKLEELQQP
jgi:hypothetical protein